MAQRLSPFPEAVSLSLELDYDGRKRFCSAEFASDSFNAFDANLGNTVYLVSDTKEYECVVDKDATDEDTITCYTV